MELHPLDLPPPKQGNGTAAASALSAESAVSSSRFHGAKPPEFVIQTEKSWHRAAALMFAAGSVTTTEVAQAFGVTRNTVNNLLRQDWFQAKVTQLMTEHGGRDIMALFKAESFNSMVTLIELRDSTKVSPNVRAVCAKDILDRALGKPVQRVEQTNIPTSGDPVREVQQLEEANKRLRNQLPEATHSLCASDALRHPGEIPEPQQPTQGE